MFSLLTNRTILKGHVRILVNDILRTLPCKKLERSGVHLGYNVRLGLGSTQDLRCLGYLAWLNPEDSAVASLSGRNSIHGRDIDMRLG
jgi:hypothetical protein